MRKSINSFELLSKKMRKKIWDMKWDSFTSIQDKTIPIIMTTEKDVIISSGTASGKTEAAFLPILSLIEESAKTKLKVIYVAPLKALINNQFERIDNLCSNMDIMIHRWHGDVNQNKKNKLISNPSGILQITPESIESIFVNRTEKAYIMFKDVEFIIIDEIHSFLDSERGVQLRSLLYRMQFYCHRRPRIIGLSATIDNFDFIKKWVYPKDIDNVEIVIAKDSDKELYYSLMHITSGEHGKKSLELYEDMRELTKQYKSLIFCNSRGIVEETTVFLNRLAKKEGVTDTEIYYAHHSSIDKKEREYVEKTMASSSSPKSIVATSSLELGIDIGEIALVIQIDSTFTVSSLKQRLGRSGRKKDDKQLLQIYTTMNDSLLQSLSVMELLLEKWIEPAIGYPVPYDILFHQIISICNETNGLVMEDLITKIGCISIFDDLDKVKIKSLIDTMDEKGYLEIISGSKEYIVGLEGERLLRSRDFYAVFPTSDEYTVQQGNKRIGQLDKKFKIKDGDNVILAGKIWTISNIDIKRDKVYVKNAVNGKPPKYFGGGIKLSSKILEKIMEILCSNQSFSYTNEKANEILRELRKTYQIYDINSSERIIWKFKDNMLFETFTGTKIFRTLTWMLKTLGVNVEEYDDFGRIKIVGLYPIIEIIEEIKNREWNKDDILKQTKETEWFKSKYFEYLPFELQVEMHMANEVDIEGVKKFLENYRIKIIN